MQLELKCWICKSKKISNENRKSFRKKKWRSISDKFGLAFAQIRFTMLKVRCESFSCVCVFFSSSSSSSSSSSALWGTHPNTNNRLWSALNELPFNVAMKTSKQMKQKRGIRRGHDAISFVINLSSSIRVSWKCKQIVWIVWMHHHRRGRGALLKPIHYINSLAHRQHPRTQFAIATVFFLPSLHALVGRLVCVCVRASFFISSALSLTHFAQCATNLCVIMQLLCVYVIHFFPLTMSSSLRAPLHQYTSIYIHMHSICLLRVSFALLRFSSFNLTLLNSNAINFQMTTTKTNTETFAPILFRVCILFCLLKLKFVLFVVLSIFSIGEY